MTDPLRRALLVLLLALPAVPAVASAQLAIRETGAVRPDTLARDTARTSALDFEQRTETGRVKPAALKELPTSVTVIDEAAIRRIAPVELADLFRGRTAGVISLDHGARNELERRIEVRGTTAFAACYACQVKVLLDGIEVSPEMVATINAQHLERVEIVRGPHATAAFGSEAATGVIQLFTKKAAAGRRDNLELSATGGLQRSPDGSGSSLTQTYAATLGGSLVGGSYSLGAAYNRAEAYVPFYDRESVALSAGFAREISDLRLSVTTRYSAKEFGNPGWGAVWYDLHQSGGLPWWVDIDENDRVELRDLLVGFSAEYTPRSWWTTRLTAGSDLLDVRRQELPTLTPGDSVRVLTVEEYALPTARLTSSVDLPFNATTGLTLSGGADWRRDRLFSIRNSLRVANEPGGEGWSGEIEQESYQRVGAFGELAMRVANRLFASVAARSDSHDVFGDSASNRVGVMNAGISYVADLPFGVRLKPRVATATGVHLPEREMVTGRTLWAPFLGNAALGPQRTRGREAGFDLEALGGRLAATATWYDQVTTDVLTPVALIEKGGQTVNGGQLSNTGYELTLRWLTETLEVAGSLTRSRNNIDELPSGPDIVFPGVERVGTPIAYYTPKLVGTAEGNLSLSRWIGRPVTAGVLVTHIGERWGTNWQSYFADVLAGTFEGAIRHIQWFPGFTRVDARTAAEIGKVEVVLEGRNLLDSLGQEVPYHYVPTRQLLATVRVGLGR